MVTFLPQPFRNFVRTHIFVCIVTFTQWHHLGEIGWQGGPYETT